MDEIDEALTRMLRSEAAPAQDELFVRATVERLIRRQEQARRRTALLMPAALIASGGLILAGAPSLDSTSLESHFGLFPDVMVALAFGVTLARALVMLKSASRLMRLETGRMAT